MALQLLDLGPGPLTHVLEKLDVRSILCAAQTCHLLYEAAQLECLWRFKALEAFPSETLSLEGYGSYKALVADGNRRHASLVLKLPGRRCLYKFNAPNYYFECRILALQWQRSDSSFRLYFDARGEEDLRHPSSSSLGFMVRRDPLADWQRWHVRLVGQLARAGSEAERALLQEEIRQHLAQREALLGAAGGIAGTAGTAGAAGTAGDIAGDIAGAAGAAEGGGGLGGEAGAAGAAAGAAGAAGTAGGAAGDGTAGIAAGEAAGGGDHLDEGGLGPNLLDGAAGGDQHFPQEPVFADLLTVVRPVRCQLAVDTPGHFMGYLEFESLDQISAILEELPDSYASKREAVENGLQLVFCYANPIPVMPHAAMVDYHAAPLLAVLPNETLQGVLQRQGCYAPNGALDEWLQQEGGEGRQRAAWAHVGEELLQRVHPPWLVQ